MKDVCTMMKHTGRWTYSAKDFEIPLCHIPPLRSFFEQTPKKVRKIRKIGNVKKPYQKNFGGPKHLIPAARAEKLKLRFLNRHEKKFVK